MPADRKQSLKPVPASRPAPAAERAERRKSISLGVLENHLGYAIRRLQIWIFQDFIRRLKEVDIRPAQFSVLVVIAANPGLSQADVAESLGIERARLVHVLDLMEERQLLQRVRSATDRRSHALHLTPEGQRLLKRAQALAAEHEAHLEKMLGGDRRVRMLEILKEADLAI
jgi:DNA-binding MarR family transcriptional regulator